MIPGCDVFSGYGRINWKLVAASGIRFVWAKCAEGNEPARNDTAFRRNVDGARENGIAVGAYFFPYPLPSHKDHPGRSPLEQAYRFAEVSGLLGSQPGELSPMVDLEWPPPEEWAEWGCSAQQVSDWGREHCEAVQILWGRAPVLYQYPWWERAVGKENDSWAHRYPLAMAAYTHLGPGMPDDSQHPPVPPPWTDWAVWQYSANGSNVRIPGIPACPVDRDCIKDEDTFRRLIGYRDSDPDVETQPNLVPSMRPSPIEAKSFSRFAEALDAATEDYRRDRDDEPPPEAA